MAETLEKLSSKRDVLREQNDKLRSILRDVGAEQIMNKAEKVEQQKEEKEQRVFREKTEKNKDSSSPSSSAWAAASRFQTSQTAQTPPTVNVFTTQPQPPPPFFTNERVVVVESARPQYTWGGSSDSGGGGGSGGGRGGNGADAGGNDGAGKSSVFRKILPFGVGFVIGSVTVTLYRWRKEHLENEKRRVLQEKIDKVKKEIDDETKERARLMAEIDRKRKQD